MGAGMAQRALMSGGLNIFGQLSQEGNEGDINLLSAGLGALSGAMTAPGGTVGEKVISPGGSDIFKVPGKNVGSFQDFTAKGIERFGADSAMGEILTGASKASKFMTDPGLMKYGIPAATATGDLMFAQAKRDQDEYDRMMEEDAASDAASDAQRAFAIRRAMEATGATEEEIEDAIYAAGYKTGGRVGLRFGGIGDAVENIEDAEMKESIKFAMQDMDIPIMDLVEEFEIQFKRKPNSIEELKQFYKDRYEYKGPGDVKMKEEIKEKVVMEAKDGGRINFDEGGVSLDEQQKEIIKGGGPKIVGLLAEADKMMGTEGDRLEMALEMLLRDNKDNELLKYMLDTAEERGETKLGVLMNLIKSQRIQDIMAFDEGKKSVVDKISVKDLARKEGSMKDGGLMNLGGKEMDLRGGGFVPIGKKERADDVPARLSKNEFVMTADAVRAAGGGSVNEGAKRMYKVMNDLEARA
jgi:hypothetical protein